MGVTTERYIRKPLYVDAVRVKAENFDEIVRWCQGEVQTDEVPGTGTTKKYIKVRVHNPKNPRQTKAFIGDWILYTDRGYKVYTNKAFRAAFDVVEGVEPKVQEMPPAQQDEEVATAEEIREKLPHAQDRRPKLVEDAKLHSVGPVAEEPSPETGVQPIESAQEGEKIHLETTPYEETVRAQEEREELQEVRPGADLGTTPQGEQIEVVEATPEAIAEVVNEQQPVDSPEESTPLVPPHTPIAPVESVAEEEQPDPVEEFEATAVPDAPPPTPAIVPPEVAPQPEPVSEDATAGKTVLSVEEQEELGPENVRELVQSGDVILAQDLAESA